MEKNPKTFKTMKSKNFCISKKVITCVSEMRHVSCVILIKNRLNDRINIYIFQKKYQIYTSAIIFNLYIF